jgi:hypothetical protein
MSREPSRSPTASRSTGHGPTLFHVILSRLQVQGRQSTMRVMVALQLIHHAGSLSGRALMLGARSRDIDCTESHELLERVLVARV